MKDWPFATRRAWIWVAVVSSSLSVCLSTSDFTLRVILLGWSEPGALIILSRSLKRRTNSGTPPWVTWRTSQHFQIPDIIGALWPPSFANTNAMLAITMSSHHLQPCQVQMHPPLYLKCQVVPKQPMFCQLLSNHVSTCLTAICLLWIKTVLLQQRHSVHFMLRLFL